MDEYSLEFMADADFFYSAALTSLTISYYCIETKVSAIRRCHCQLDPEPDRRGCAKIVLTVDIDNQSNAIAMCQDEEANVLQKYLFLIPGSASGFGPIFLSQSFVKTNHGVKKCSKSLLVMKCFLYFMIF